MFEELRATINARDAFARFLGITVDEISAGYARASMPQDARLCNGLGNLHGGACFTLADMAFSAVAMSGGITTVNISSCINFAHAGKKGPFTAIGKLITESRKLCTIEVTITDGEGGLTAVFTGTGYRFGTPFLDTPPA